MSFATIALWPVLIASLGVPKISPEPSSSDDAIVGTAIPDPQPAATVSQAGAKDGKEALKPPDRFRWDQHPSLHLGKGTRIDFRARFQGDLRESDAFLDAAEENSGLD